MKAGEGDFASCSCLDKELAHLVHRATITSLRRRDKTPLVGNFGGLSGHYLYEKR